MNAKHSARCTRAAALVVMLLVAISPVWADTSVATGSEGTKKLCYCNCDSKHGTMMCTHMCELPKYTNRWWATFCRKIEEKLLPSAPAAPDQGSSSKKNNRVQEARR